MLFDVRSETRAVVDGVLSKMDPLLHSSIVSLPCMYSGFLWEGTLMEFVFPEAPAQLYVLSWPSAKLQQLSSGLVGR